MSKEYDDRMIDFTNDATKAGLSAMLTKSANFTTTKDVVSLTTTKDVASLSCSWSAAAFVIFISGLAMFLDF